MSIVDYSLEFSIAESDVVRRFSVSFKASHRTAVGVFRVMKNKAVLSEDSQSAAYLSRVEIGLLDKLLKGATARVCERGINALEWISSGRYVGQLEFTEVS
jgi:hypothetical protein